MKRIISVLLITCLVFVFGVLGFTVFAVSCGGGHGDVSVINRTVATKTTDGYTGDLYCNTCKQTIEYGRTVYSDGEIGDANGDGTANSFDRIVLSRFLAGWDNYEYEISPNLADVNKDGTITQADRIVFSRYLAGWAGYSTYFGNSSMVTPAPGSSDVGPSDGYGKFIVVNPN